MPGNIVIKQSASYGKSHCYINGTFTNVLFTLLLTDNN